VEEAGGARRQGLDSRGEGAAGSSGAVGRTYYGEEWWRAPRGGGTRGGVAARREGGGGEFRQPDGVVCVARLRL